MEALSHALGAQIVLHVGQRKRFLQNAKSEGYAAVMYPGVPVVSMRKYAYPVLLLAHTVLLPPTSDVEHE